MRLVCNQQVDRLSIDGRDHFGALDEIDRRNRDRMPSPRIHAKRQRRDSFGDRRLVEDGGGDAEPIAQLARPRVAQAGGTHDQGVFDPPAFPQLGKKQARLDGLAEANGIRKQHACRAANDRQRGLQLIRPQLDHRARCRPQAIEPANRDRGMKRGSQHRATRPPPQPGAGDSSRAIEWSDHDQPSSTVGPPATFERQDRTGSSAPDLCGPPLFTANFEQCASFIGRQHAAQIVQARRRDRFT